MYLLKVYSKSELIKPHTDLLFEPRQRHGKVPFSTVISKSVPVTTYVDDET